MKGVSSLGTAAAYGDVALAKSLLEDGDDVDVKNEDGMTPLAIAAFWGHDAIVKLLVKRGANINIANDGTGWTPLHCATFQGHGKSTMILLRHNAEMSVHDKQGRTSIDFASADDAIWGHFASAGCTRTSKAELVALGIIHRAKSQPKSKDEIRAAEHEGQNFAHYTRPGSAYVVSRSMHGSGSGAGAGRRQGRGNSGKGDVLEHVAPAARQEPTVPSYQRRSQRAGGPMFG